MKYSKYNVVIIGSGISGLFLANKLIDNNSFKDEILLITKTELFSGSSSLAQGGIVSVIPELNPIDSVESHISDTIKAGCGLNNLNTVKMVSEASADAAQDLINFGVNFDKNDKNILNFTLEGAHSVSRILHAQGDSTGRVIEETLSSRLKSKENIVIYENTMAVKLLIDKTNTCHGLIAYNHNKNTYEAIYTNNLIIATGGIGQIYKTTTNPIESTADGIALAINSGAEVENMEFVQFHPTSLYCKSKDTMPLVSESVRGEGAKLVDVNGTYFSKNYHHKADLAPRDVVARAIIEQIKLTNSNNVYLDISQIGIEKFKKRFPTITKLCSENDVDITQGLIPVVPSEHYFMGGIKTDLEAKTSIKNLYAIGECASSGLHGANRLASNSLLECVVFADILSKKLNEIQTEPPKKFDEKVKKIIDDFLEEESDFEKKDEEIKALFKKLKEVMTKHVGILRDEKGLITALDRINELSIELKNLNALNSRIKFEFQNALKVAKSIVKAALERKESIGAHYRSDFEKKQIEQSYFSAKTTEKTRVNTANDEFLVG